MGEITVGHVFSGHRIDALVGRGGMGVVYRATQVALDRPVALKVITSDLVRDPDFRERFQRESRRAASIEHPHVLPVHQAGEEDGLMFLTMRLVEGIDLRALIRSEGRLEPRRAARITAQVAEALDAAHRRGLVHRDVKPGNVLLDDPGGVDHAYLTDFGLTKSTDSTANLTDTGEWVGTLDYVAPEQIEAKGVDARTDVYALGCLLYHAVGGEVPFPADNYAAKVWAHLNKSPPQLAGRVPGVPEALDRVVAKAMEKDPDDRYQSAGAMGEAVLAAVDAPATAATAPSARPRGAKAAPEGDEPARRRFGTALKVAGVAALAAVAALIGTLIVPSGGGGNVAAADVRALLERYQADFTNEDVPALETLLAPGFQRVYLSDPPVDRARSIAKYRIRFAAAKTPRFVITGVRIDTGTHDATAVGRYSLTAAGQPHLGDVGSAVYHLVARHGTLQFDRITSYPDVLFYTPAAMRGQSGVTVDATARLPAGAGRSTVVAHGSGPLPDAGLVSVPLNGAGRTLVRSTQRLVVDVTYRRADGRVTRQAPFTVSFAPRP